MTDVAGRTHLDAAGQFRATLATYRESEDLINIGAYAKGSNAKIDDAIAKMGGLTDYVRQPVDKRVTFEESVAHLESLFPAR
jgi:flagellum-specific ATP synthase